MTKGGRPSKYNWDYIQEAYENGFDRDEICKQYKITPKQLSNKINENKWVIKGTVKSDLVELSEEILKHSENVTKLHPDNQELALKVFETRGQDQELIMNNRKISKLLQSIIISKRGEINLQNIKNVSGVLKDIESIANPHPETVINNANVQENTIPIINLILDKD